VVLSETSQSHYVNMNNEKTATKDVEVELLHKINYNIIEFTS